MIELGPIKQRDQIIPFYEKANLKENEFSGCVKAEEKGAVLGFCLYDLTPDKMVIRYIEPISNLAFADGILRSTLHVAAEKSIMNAFYVDTVPEEFFEKLNFIKEREEKSLNIDKLFESCCSCSGDK